MNLMETSGGFSDVEGGTEQVEEAARAAGAREAGGTGEAGIAEVAVEDARMAGVAEVAVDDARDMEGAREAGEACRGGGDTVVPGVRNSRQLFIQSINGL